MASLIHEMFGVVSEQMEREKLEHRKTIDVLRRVVLGEVPVDRLRVTESSWSLLPEPRAPELDDMLEAIAGRLGG